MLNTGTRIIAFLSFSIVFAVQASLAEEPKTIKEAYQRVAQVFGPQLENPILTRFKQKTEVTTQPDPSGEKVVVSDDSSVVYTSPSLVGDSIVLHENEQNHRVVYNLSESGERTINRELDRVYAMEFRISQDREGIWVYQSIIQNHSLARYVGSVASTGTVRWLDNGFEVHSSGFDNYYAPDGTLTPAAYTHVAKFTKTGGKVVVSNEHQMYELAKSKDGQPWLFPDTSKPLGELIKYTKTSTARPASE